MPSDGAADRLEGVVVAGTVRGRGIRAASGGRRAARGAYAPAAGRTAAATARMAAPAELRMIAPTAGPTIKPSCHAKPVTAMYRLRRSGRARSATNGP